jgi:hypothetical protein
MGVGLKWCTITCNKTLNSFLLKKEAFSNFWCFQKHVKQLCGWLTLKFIYFQTIITFCFKSFYNCSIPWILQFLCSLHLDFAHSFSKYGAWNTKHRLSFWSQMPNVLGCTGVLSMCASRIATKVLQTEWYHHLLLLQVLQAQNPNLSFNGLAGPFVGLSYKSSLTEDTTQFLQWRPADLSKKLKKGISEEVHVLLQQRWQTNPHRQGGESFTKKCCQFRRMWQFEAPHSPSLLQQRLHWIN